MQTLLKALYWNIYILKIVILETDDIYCYILRNIHFL